MYKEKLYKHELEINSLETCDTVYQQICNMLELDPKRVLLLNENGMLKYNQWVESANLFNDNTVV